ncbi:hypothetical protein FKW77_004712 [Venturia effusa]|uniref:Secreted protein n=1 Tax=Venturia effusa TaxID=50376 RepID=A0A517LLE0_9PEZI|nr:hypothetical protein FKW77_004712 [Venturia effusa]
MHITSYLATLLALAPAAVLGKGDCTQAKTTYRYKCNALAHVCDAGSKPLPGPVGAAMAATHLKWIDYSHQWMTGGICSGWCEKPYVKAMPPFSGTTWMMDCYMPRMRAPSDADLPELPDMIEVDSVTRKCVYIPCDGECDLVFGRC